MAVFPVNVTDPFNSKYQNWFLRYISGVAALCVCPFSSVGFIHPSANNNLLLSNMSAVRIDVFPAVTVMVASICPPVGTAGSAGLAPAVPARYDTTPVELT